MTQDQNRDWAEKGAASSKPIDADPDLFRSAFDAAGIAMIVTGPDLDAPGPTISFANRAMTSLTGYLASELVGQSSGLLRGSGSNRAEARRRKRKLLHDGTYTGEALNYRRDGSSYVADWTITAIPGRNGDIRGWLAIQHDETERRRTLETLANAEARQNALFESIPHLVWQSHDGGDWCAASPQWKAFTGQSETASHGAGWRKMIDPRDLATTDEAWRSADGSGVLTVEHRIRRHDGAFRWFQTRALPVPADAPRSHNRIWIGTSTDVDDLHNAQERIRHLAFHDVLTDLSNRSMLHQELGRMTLGACGGEPFNLLCLDVDDFKLVNDQLGHQGGDEVLREISRRLLSWLRDGDIVARVGGDEFVLIQAEAKAEDGLRLANRIAVRMAEPFAIDGKELRISTSIGIASFPADGVDADELLQRADLALYNAKAHEHTRVQRFEQPMEFIRQERLAIQTGLGQAVERDELALAYQVVCDTQTGAVHGYEALARWTHPERGTVSPAVFIPIAEESGLIEPIGLWILERACREATGKAFSDRRMAVNLSPAQFLSGRLAQTIVDVLARTGLAPERLELEVTERLLMDNSDGIDRTLRDIKAIGVKIALDDFGTGYSNLGYLCRFPFDRLKIDQSFVRRMGKDDGARAVVSGIIALAHSLHLCVTAEGVETEEQLMTLQAMGCDQVQGFLLGRPVSVQDLEHGSHALYKC